MSKMGRPRELSDLKCQTCPQFVTVNDKNHALTRCADCRKRDPISPPRWKQEKPHTTEESVWIGASRDGFSARMALHFAVVGPGKVYYNDTIADKGGRRLLKRMRAGGL
jgi:hypothetical protein